MMSVLIGQYCFTSWAGQLIPLIESESIRELLRTVHPSMRRDVRTLFLFLPYVLLHSIMSKNNPQYVQEEILAVIGEFLVLFASYLNLLSILGNFILLPK